MRKKKQKKKPKKKRSGYCSSFLLGFTRSWLPRGLPTARWLCAWLR
jgi:hypothetical protein